MQVSISLSFFFFLLTLTNPLLNLHAQGCCSGGTPLSGNLNINVTPPKTLSARLLYDYNNLGDVVVRNKKIEDKTRIRTSNSILLRLNYSLGKRWAATALLSFVEQVEKVEFSNFFNLSKGQGFGDAIVLLQWNPLNENHANISLASGLKIPSGNINQTNKNTGLLLPPDLQPGTGSTDYFFSAQTSLLGFLNDNLNLQASSTFRLTGVAERFNQQQLYKFGNELQTFISINYSIYLKKSILLPEIAFSWRFSEFDQTDKRQTSNTGGHWFYLGTGLRYLLNTHWGISIFASFPVYRNLTGVQLTTSYRLTFGIDYSITFRDKTEFIKVF